MRNIFSIQKRTDHLSSDRSKIEEALKRYTLFRELSLKQLSNLAPALRIKKFKDEEISCHCPDAKHEAFLLLSGVAAVTRKKGELTYVLQLERTGSVFNINSLVGLDPEKTQAKVLGDAEILALDNSMLIQKLKGDPELGYKFLTNAARLAFSQYEDQLERYVQ